MATHIETILAALVHDVGKFGQRANAPGEGLGAEAKALADFLCPTWAGRPTHLHAAYTAQFIMEHMSYLPPGVDQQQVLRLAAYHHRPSKSEEELIAVADRLSSGMEREVQESGGRTGFRQVRLRAIVNEIAQSGRAPGEWSHKLRPLDPQEAFPGRWEEGPDGNLTDEYRELYQSFLADWSLNRVPDPWGFINRAMSVLERFTWCIPSATNVYPDISLFDHLKTTAAIAACLTLTEPGASEPFLLIAGDLGGIQSFLYHLHSGAGGLARRLRARSLFVSLAAESTVHFLLRQLGLPLTNCILSAGGRFTLLLPNSSAAWEALAAAKKQLAKWTQQETGCELHPHLACLPLAREGLGDFGVALHDLEARLRAQKARPLQDALQDEQYWDENAFLLDPLPVVAEGGLCSVCGRRAGPLRRVREQQVPVCERCFEDAELGRRLVHARFAVFSNAPGRLPFGTVELLAEERDIRPDAYLAVDLDGGSGCLPETPVVGRYTARYVPRDSDGSVTEFSDLAAQSKGRPAIAYCKADVDNLGQLFRFGLQGKERDRRSVSRLSTLSRSLELFFSGYVEHLAQKFDTYTVYSGGDDLLLVGPWNRVLELAAELRRQFRRYTCGNPSWSLSAGITLVGAKTPVLAAVEEANSQLEAAKATPGGGVCPWPFPLRGKREPPAKDRLVALGTSLPWSEVDRVLERAERLLGWLKEGGLGTAQVHRLLTYGRMFQEWQRTGDVLYFRYAPMLVYDLRRNWGHAPREALEWARGLTVRESSDIPALRFVSEYALYGARSTGKETDPR